MHERYFQSYVPVFSFYYVQIKDIKQLGYTCTALLLKICSRTPFHCWLHNNCHNCKLFAQIIFIISNVISTSIFSSSYYIKKIETVFACITWCKFLQILQFNSQALVWALDLRSWDHTNNSFRVLLYCRLCKHGKQFLFPKEQLHACLRLTINWCVITTAYMYI